jgi:peptidoglycan-associated lipoprotein
MFGCAHEAKPAQAPSAGAVIVTSAASATGSKSGAFAMSDELRRVCGIEDTAEAPKFAFDAAALSPSDRNELDQLVKCMTTGPLAGKNVELVGRADPRGEEEYNMSLGARRATAVEQYLTRLGVAESRLPTTTRGALDAQGHDETTWAIDRRVDLRIAGR